MNKKKATLVVALIAIGIAVLGLSAAVYAKYISFITKTGTATVAKWAFTTDNETGTVTCELDKTYNANTLVAGKIAPGTSGKCPIVISNASTEVGVKYDIKPSTVTNQPKNLKFYKEATHTNEITADGTATITGNLAPKAAATTVYVYWEWPYEDGSDDAYDSKDTADGEAGATMTMTFDVTGTQIAPAE